MTFHNTAMAAIGECPACNVGEHVTSDGRCDCCDEKAGGVA